MSKLRSVTAAAIVGLGTLALLAAPSFATDSAGTETQEPPLQLAHMGQDHMGGWGGQPWGMGMMHPPMSGHGFGMGMMQGGHGMGRPMMMRPVAMTPCAGSGMHATAPAMDLTVDGVRDSLEGMLAWHGNDRLKVGEVSEIDDGTVLAEIVTVDGSLVERLEVDRHTGQMQRRN